MSWFLHVVNLTPEGKQWKPDEAWPENGLIPLGTRAEIHALIGKLFPESDFSDPFWIPVWFFVGDEKYGMEIVLNHDEPVKWISLRHGGIEAVRLIHEHTGWDVFDPNNELIDFSKEG